MSQLQPQMQQKTFRLRSGLLPLDGEDEEGVPNNINGAQHPYPNLSPSDNVSQCAKLLKCHAEQKRSICFSHKLQQSDSSPAAQNDVMTQSLKEEGIILRIVS